MKLSDIVAATRRLLHDADPDTQRWTDDDYYDAVSRALMAAYRHRTDLFIGSLADTLVYTSADASVEPPLDSTYHDLLPLYAAGWLELADDPQTNQARAEARFQHFYRELGAR